MKNNKYKILVLSDMKDTTINTVKSGISLAKMIDADLHFFHVKEPTEVVKQESQLSAIRTINRSYLDTTNEIQSLVESLSKDFEITISQNHTFGNIKSEISEYIKAHKPDIIILGKRKSKPFSFIGDNVTDYVLNTFDGAVMIASAENALEPNKELSLGVLNSLDLSFNSTFTKNILGHSQKPLKSFRTGQKTNASDKLLKDNNTLELVFDHGENSIKSLSNYLTKSNVNLLCIDRHKENKSNMKNVIKNVNVSLLIYDDNHIQS